jgi:putative transposase
MPDHVHLLVEVDPQYRIHRLVKEIKGLSSRLLRGGFKHLTTRMPTLWTSFCAEKKILHQHHSCLNQIL